MSNKEFSGRVVHKNKITIIEVELMAIAELKNGEYQIYTKNIDGNDIFVIEDNKNAAFLLNTLSLFREKTNLYLEQESFKESNIRVHLNLEKDDNFDFVLIDECKYPRTNKVLVNKRYIDRVTHKTNIKSIKKDANFSSTKVKMHEKCYYVKSIDFGTGEGEDSIKIKHVIGEIYLKGLSGSIVNFGLREDFEKDLF